MKQPFTAEQARAVISYDADTGLFTRINSPKQVVTAGWRDYKGYLKVEVLGKRVFCHRLAWLLTHGHWPDGEVDHVNGSKDDNRMQNLRVCTHQQNNHNQRARITNSSGVKNVSWHRKAGKWHVQVCLNYQIHHGGLFADISDAARAAVELRNKLHGDFANHG